MHEDPLWPIFPCPALMHCIARALEILKFSLMARIEKRHGKIPSERLPHSSKLQGTSALGLCSRLTKIG